MRQQRHIHALAIVWFCLSENSYTILCIYKNDEQVNQWWIFLFIFKKKYLWKEKQRYFILILCNVFRLLRWIIQQIAYRQSKSFRLLAQVSIWTLIILLDSVCEERLGHQNVSWAVNYEKYRSKTPTFVREPLSFLKTYLER